MSIATMAPAQQGARTRRCATTAPGTDGQLLLFPPADPAVSRVAEPGTPAPAPDTAPAPPRRSGAPQRRRRVVRRRRRSVARSAPCRRPAAAPARPAPRAIRLTGRGRLVLLGVAVALLIGVAVASHASPERVPAGPSGGSVVVQPGETLWDVARRAEPQADPHQAVVDLEQRNRLRTVVLHPGQRLLLPAS